MHSFIVVFEIWIKSFKKLLDHSVQGVLSNINATIIVDTRIKISVKIKHNKANISIYAKIKNEVIIVEIVIISRHKLSEIEREKKSKYDKLANEAKMMYKADRVKIISYVLTWDGLVTTYHSKYVKELNLSPSIEAYSNRVLSKRRLRASLWTIAEAMKKEG